VALALRIYLMYLQNSLKLSLVVTEDTMVVALALPFAGGNPLSRLNLLTSKPSTGYWVW
jgi:hypothetical protein